MVIGYGYTPPGYTPPGYWPEGGGQVNAGKGLLFSFKPTTMQFSAVASPFAFSAVATTMAFRDWSGPLNFLINERNSAEITVDFFDFNNDPIVPASIDITIYDRESQQVLATDTPTPAASVTIELHANETQILDDTKKREAHSVLVKAVYQTGPPIIESNGVFTFEVVNLDQLSGSS